MFAGSVYGEDQPPRYLAFQFFTASGGAHIPNWDVQPKDLPAKVSELKDLIGVMGTDNRHLGFILGLLSFDNTDEEIREFIASGFDTALKTGVAVGFHIDNSMFWGRLKELNTPENIEWLDWGGAPSGGRVVKWDPPNKMKLLPPLCLNSRGVLHAVRVRASLIGNEIAKGLVKLREAGEQELAIGVIAGSETQIGRDFDTGKTVGFCALTNAGYSEENPPAHIDAARSQIVRAFIDVWAQALTEAGVPQGKVYSHVGLDSGRNGLIGILRFLRPRRVDVSLPGICGHVAKSASRPWQSALGFIRRHRHGPTRSSARGTGYRDGGLSWQPIQSRCGPRQHIRVGTGR